MCWNGEASAVVAAIGLGSTAYAVYKREPIVLTTTLCYFSLMELLQAVAYTVVDQCGTPLNDSMTLLGYLHIAFQPFFINAVSLYFVAKDVRRKVSPWVYSVCFVSSLLLVLNIYPFPWAGLCEALYREMCSTRLCSYYGNVHIAWEFPMNGMFNWMKIEGHRHINAWMIYGIPAFILPMLYGSWKMTLYHVLMGPVPAIIITRSSQEMAAFWCLLSIMFLLIVVKTPIRRILFVDKWFWWKRPAGEVHEPERLVVKPA
jgi:hypothetical protein